MLDAIHTSACTRTNTWLMCIFTVAYVSVLDHNAWAVRTCMYMQKNTFIIPLHVCPEVRLYIYLMHVWWGRVYECLHAFVVGMHRMFLTYCFNAHCSARRRQPPCVRQPCVLFAVTALLRNRFYGCPTPPRHSYFSPAHPRQPWGRYHTETDGTLVCTAGWSEVTCGCSLVAGSSQRSEKGSSPHRP